MGQYYIVCNVDQKKLLDPRVTGYYSKLMEFAYSNSKTSTALRALMCGQWKGDTIAIVGDYAGLYDGVWTQPLDAMTEALNNEAMRIGDSDMDRSDPTLYWRAVVEFERITAAEIEGAKKAIAAIGKPRYVVNHARKQYIDMDKCPIEWEGRGLHGGTERIFIDPLIVLLAMGNRCGGGDYYGHNADLAGTWCGDSQSIELMHTLCVDTEGYTELEPGFTEHW